MNERLTYVLRFHRPAYASGQPEPPTTGSGLTVTTTIEGGTLSSQVEELDGGTLSSQVEELDGATATLALEFQVNATQGQFVESGTLTFGDARASALTFVWLDAGTLLPADSDGFSHGTIAYGVTGGSGALAGAQGIISSNFLVNLDPSSNELWDTHLGIISLP